MVSALRRLHHQHEFACILLGPSSMVAVSSFPLNATSNLADGAGRHPSRGDQLVYATPGGDGAVVSDWNLFGGSIVSRTSSWSRSALGCGFRAKAKRIPG